MGRINFNYSGGASGRECVDRVGNVEWKENFIICEVDDIDVVLGLMFREAYNKVLKGKKR